MKILVTGGTGVIGEGVIPELLARGHSVRLLSRHADDDAKRWPDVEPFQGNVADSVDGAATGCDAILHIAGIVAEDPPLVTFERVNVGGTRNMVAEAERGNASRFIHISSLGVDTGKTDYHRSKKTAEAIVESSRLRWTILRPGNVYGPGDEVISTMLKMVRALPAVPVISGGDQPFQPIWHEDLGRAVVAVLEKDESGKTMELAGDDVTSMNDLLDRFAKITGRKPLRLPTPMALASLVTRLAGAASHVSIDDTKLQMLREHNVLRGPNGLNELGVDTTPLDEGLRKLADALPEKMAEDGVGSMHHKRFWADIAGSRFSAAQLMTIFKEKITDVMPIEFAAEPGVPTKVERGVTLTGALPMRGNIQIRVEVCEPGHVVFCTVEGHPLAGIVEFTSKDAGGTLQFAIDTYTRAATTLDFVALNTVGNPAQSANWVAVVERMIEESGGTSDGVKRDSAKLEEEEAARVEKRIRSIIQARERASSPAAENAPQR